MTAKQTLTDIVREAGRNGEAPFDIAGAALALAAMDRTGVALDRYHDELAMIVDAVASRERDLPSGASPVDRMACLGDVLAEELSYRGDFRTYDDLQNANLMRVMDRRKGLPVSLGILYLHAARGQGWQASGLNTPGHFMIRVENADTMTILDPFNGGQPVDSATMRALIERATGNRGTLGPDATRIVSDRSVLLRLQNNIKLRLYQAERHADALAVVGRMRLLVPDDPGLLHESGLLNARLGNLGAAAAQLEQLLDAGTGTDRQRHGVALVLQRIRRSLN